MFNPKTMGDCDYSVPYKIFGCRFSGGRNEPEIAAANALNPNRNPIPIGAGFHGHDPRLAREQEVFRNSVPCTSVSLSACGARLVSASSGFASQRSAHPA